MFIDIESDPDIRVVILTGTGNAFVAGVDITDMKDNNPVSIERFNQNPLVEAATVFII